MEHDERGLIFQALPDRGFGMNEQCTTIAIFVAASNIKEKYVAIWKSENPRYLKRFDTLTASSLL